MLYVGIANPQWQGKHSQHPRRMRNPQFCASGKRPMGSWEASNLSGSLLFVGLSSHKDNAVYMSVTNTWMLCLISEHKSTDIIVFYVKHLDKLSNLRGIIKLTEELPSYFVSLFACGACCFHVCGQFSGCVKLPHLISGSFEKPRLLWLKHWWLRPADNGEKMKFRPEQMMQRQERGNFWEHKYRYIALSISYSCVCHKTHEGVS